MMRTNKEKKLIMWSVILMITISPFVTDLATAAWISYELPDEVVIGKKYQNILVNLTSGEHFRGVSSGALYLGDPSTPYSKELDHVDKDPGYMGNFSEFHGKENFTRFQTNLADGYENFYFNFTITKNMVIPDKNYSFYLEFNFTNPNETKVFYVSTRATIGPISDFSWKLSWWQGKPMVNKTVHFRDKSKKGYEDIISWQWDFGDGSISSKQNPEHIYSNIGTYNITLTIEDENGDMDSYVKQIKIYEERNFPVVGVVVLILVVLLVAIMAVAFIKKRR